MLGVCKIARLLSASSYCQLFLLSGLPLAVMCQGRIVCPCSSIAQLTDAAVFPAMGHKEMLSHPCFPQTLQQACRKDCLCMPASSILSTSDSILRRNQKEEGGMWGWMSRAGLLKEERMQEVPLWVVLAWAGNKCRISTVGWGKTLLIQSPKTMETAWRA